MATARIVSIDTIHVAGQATFSPKPPVSQFCSILTLNSLFNLNQNSVISGRNIVSTNDGAGPGQDAWISTENFTKNEATFTSAEMTFNSAVNSDENTTFSLVMSDLGLTDLVGFKVFFPDDPGEGTILDASGTILFTSQTIFSGYTAMVSINNATGEGLFEDTNGNSVSLGFFPSLVGNPIMFSVGTGTDVNGSIDVDFNAGSTDFDIIPPAPNKRWCEV